MAEIKVEMNTFEHNILLLFITGVIIATTVMAIRSWNLILWVYILFKDKLTENSENPL